VPITGSQKHRRFSRASIGRVHRDRPTSTHPERVGAITDPPRRRGRHPGGDSRPPSSVLPAVISTPRPSASPDQQPSHQQETSPDATRSTRPAGIPQSKRARDPSASAGAKQKHNRQRGEVRPPVAAKTGQLAVGRHPALFRVRRRWPPAPGVRRALARLRVRSHTDRPGPIVDYSEVPVQRD
jgi:hypothetical protein